MNDVARRFEKSQCHQQNHCYLRPGKGTGEHEIGASEVRHPGSALEVVQVRETVFQEGRFRSRGMRQQRQKGGNRGTVFAAENGRLPEGRS